MATQRTTHGLSLQPGAAQGALDTSLDAELTRYRRNRRLKSLSQDVYSNIEGDPDFDVEPIKSTLASTPPPVPPNKKLIAAGYYDDHGSPESNRPALPCSAQPVSDSPVADNPVSDNPVDEPNEPTINPSGVSPSAWLGPTNKADETKAVGSEIVSTIVPQTQSSLDQLIQAQHPRRIAQSPPGMGAPSGYLASSTKLIESLEDKSAQPYLYQPAISRSRHKTVSLLAGAVLGYLGFLAGLGASYIVSNPLIAHRLAHGLTSPSGENSAATTFDPPGPDLSSVEFVNLEIDNLSSLQMPESDLITPPSTPGVINSDQPPAAPANLAGSSAASALAETGTILPTDSLSSDSVATEPQAAISPVGLMTYYVTVPFTSEQALWEIRQTISEAFVRRFADGNRIQIAAFDNAQSAKQFLEKINENNIGAEVYGPTTE